jgi:flagellar hook-basal body complex protein FliE
MTTPASSLAASLYAAARPATRPSDAAGEIARQAVTDFAAILKEGERAAAEAITGNADMAALVQALAASELAVETVVTVRNKVVEAYQEILRMPV